jgi:hypothetical protein
MPRLTLKQERAAQVLASGKADSYGEAAALAKVSRSTVIRLSQSDTGQRAIERLRANQSDKARGIYRKAATALEGQLGPHTDPRVNALAWKTAADVIATGVEEQQDEVDHAPLVRMLRLWLRHARRYGVAATEAQLTTRYGG